MVVECQPWRCPVELRHQLIHEPAGFGPDLGHTCGFDKGDLCGNAVATVDDLRMGRQHAYDLGERESVEGGKQFVMSHDLFAMREEQRSITLGACGGVGVARNSLQGFDANRKTVR